MLTLRPLSASSPSERVGAWNAAYAGYAVPLAFDQAMLERHVRRSGIDLDLSVTGLLDRVEIGVSFAATRGSRAWIGGFGVFEPHRRRGLATRLMQAHLERLAEAGFAETWLEVIDSNPAREVYRRCGFVEVRRLRLFEGRPASGKGSRLLTIPQLRARHAVLNETAPTWRRDLPTLVDSIELEGARALGVDGGYAVTADQGERLAVLDAAVRDLPAGERLLAALAAVAGDRSMRLVDEPDGTPLALACEAAGLSNPLNQWEMARRA
ncbi:MAG: GNAT family N-acetyltransferase [Caulobacteraceae bacterium]|nr:GNAT family N-acetyltransferase [Caulobacteraceae bacterium]